MAETALLAMALPFDSAPSHLPRLRQAIEWARA